MRKQIHSKVIRTISIVLGITGVLVVLGCSNSGSSSNGGGNVPVTNSSVITIDNAGTIPVFGNSSTTTVVYVHNNGTKTISGITYTAKLNSSKTSSVLSAKLTKLLQSNKNLTGVIGEQCSTIAAGQSCPLSITTPVLSGSNTQGSMQISASYKYNNKDNTFSQIVNYSRVQNDQLAAGAIFQAGTNISGFGNSVGYATIYLYGSGHNQVYDVSSMTINKPAVTIVNGNISGHQIQSNFVQAVEVSSPILSSSLSATITVKSSVAQNKSMTAVKTVKSTNNALQITNEFTSSVDLSVEPTSSGAILTTGLVPLINTATSTSGSMLVLNSGNQPAQIGSVSAGSGIGNLSGCSNSTLAAGDSCSITFSVSEGGGSANITVPYSGGSAGSVVGNVTWYNGVGAPLVTMSAADNPLTFPATVGSSTTVTVTNVGGYTLEEISIPTPVVVGGSATASVSSNTCTSSLAINASCSYVVTVADSATDLNQQINLGFIASYAGSSGSQSYSRVMPLSYSSTSYGAIISIDPSSASVTITGNNNESTTQVLTISNSGNVPANISRALSDNPAYLSESASNCGATLNAESSCSVTLQFGPTYSADSSSGSSVYTVNYTAAGQTPSGSVSSTIDWTVQSYAQGISLTEQSALGSTSGNGETSETQYNFTALGRDQVITKSITLTYTNTGTNSMKITGIQDGNSPYTWQVGGNGTTCIPGTTILAPTDTCKIVYDSVFESNILALRNVGTTYTENLTVPTLVYQDATNSNVQFSAQPNLPTGGVTIYAQSNQATLANSVTVNELGTPYESVTISHLLANADDSLYVTVTSKMEDYFVTIPTLGDPTGCSYSSANGLITQTCIMGKNDPSLSVTYMVNQSLLNNDSDLTLTVLFSTDNLSQIVAMNQIYATVNLGLVAPCNPCHIFVTNGTHDGNLSQECSGAGCATSSESGILGADSICQAEARTNHIAGTFKAIVLSSTRYPCDASGECGDSHMSNWVIHANTVYENLAGGSVATSNGQYVLPQPTQWPSYADGTVINSDPLFTGISVGRVNAAKTDIDAWSPFDINSSVPGYSLQNCNDWTSTDGMAVSAAPTSWFGTNGDASNWYAGYGNASSYYVFSQWVNSAQACGVRRSLICAQQ